MRVQRLFYLFLLPLLLIASQGLTQLPQGPHPRIFLSDSLLTVLKERVAANTPEWQSLQMYLSDYLTEEPWGSQYLDGIPSFALAYLLTEDTTYANRALSFMNKWVTSLNGTHPLEVSGDDYAHLYEAIGLGYDWLYNYPSFTSDQKKAVVNTMNRVFDYGQTSWDQGGGDFYGDPHDSDQIIGGAKTAFIWGAATYGDNPKADTLIAQSRALWNTYIRQWIRQSIGGVWPEGSQYSYNTLYFLLVLTEAERTAGGKDYWNETPDIRVFPRNALMALFWLMPPSNDHILTYNDQEDDNAHYWRRRNHFTAIATSVAENLGFDTEASYGRYWIRDICHDNLDMNLWKLFLWYDRTAPHINYFHQHLPNTYFSPGTDWIFLRSNWSTQATYSTFNATWTNIDHQFMDGGHFNIWKNGEYLTRQVRHYDFVFTVQGKQQRYDGETSNILLIQSDYEDNEYINAMGSPEFFESAGEPKISRYRANADPLFAYACADLGASYNRVYDEWGGNSNRVRSYTRQFVQISPDYFVIYDRVRTKNTGWVKYVLHSLTEPVVSGNTVIQISESGSQRLLNRTLFPKNVHITKINEADVWNTAHGLAEDWMLPESERKWHVSIRPSDSDTINMLNVIETAAGPALAIEKAQLVEGENVLGAQMGNWVVVFAKGTARISRTVYRYAIAGASHHLVCDLDSNQTFRIERNGTLLQTAKTGPDGTLFFAVDNPGSVATISIDKSTTVVGDEATTTPHFQLCQNYPNPFNSTTTIAFTLFRECFVSLRVFNVLGEQVALLINERKKAGNYRVRFAGKNLQSGLYVYRLQAGDYSEVRKILLQK